MSNTKTILRLKRRRDDTPIDIVSINNPETVANKKLKKNDNIVHDSIVSIISGLSLNQKSTHITTSSGYISVPTDHNRFLEPNTRNTSTKNDSYINNSSRISHNHDDSGYISEDLPNTNFGCLDFSNDKDIFGKTNTKPEIDIVHLNNIVDKGLENDKEIVSTNKSPDAPSNTDQDNNELNTNHYNNDNLVEKDGYRVVYRRITTFDAVDPKTNTTNMPSNSTNTSTNTHKTTNKSIIDQTHKLQYKQLLSSINSDGTIDPSNTQNSNLSNLSYDNNNTEVDVEFYDVGSLETAYELRQARRHKLLLAQHKATVSLTPRQTGLSHAGEGICDANQTQDNNELSGLDLLYKNRGKPGNLHSKDSRNSSNNPNNPNNPIQHIQQDPLTLEYIEHRKTLSSTTFALSCSSLSTSSSATLTQEPVNPTHSTNMNDSDHVYDIYEAVYIPIDSHLSQTPDPSHSPSPSSPVPMVIFGSSEVSELYNEDLFPSVHLPLETTWEEFDDTPEGGHDYYKNDDFYDPDADEVDYPEQDVDLDRDVYYNQYDNMYEREFHKDRYDSDSDSDGDYKCGDSDSEGLDEYTKEESAYVMEVLRMQMYDSEEENQEYQDNNVDDCVDDCVDISMDDDNGVYDNGVDEGEDHSYHSYNTNTKTQLTLPSDKASNKTTSTKKSLGYVYNHDYLSDDDEDNDMYGGSNAFSKFRRGY